MPGPVHVAIPVTHPLRLFGSQVVDTIEVMNVHNFCFNACVISRVCFHEKAAPKGASSEQDQRPGR